MELGSSEPMEIGTPTGNVRPAVRGSHRRIIYEDESPTASPCGGVSGVSTNMLTALLKRPLKMCTSSDSVTPGRENTILRRGIRGLVTDSPCRGEVFKRPLEGMDMSSPIDPKKAKAVTFNGEIKPLSLQMLNTECTPPNKKTKNEMEDICNGAKHEAAKKLPALKTVPSPATTISRALSESHVNIMKAVEGFGKNPGLIGDGSKCYSLPTVQGKHSDLKEISSETLAALLRGEFAGQVSGFEIVDCRYPYEYSGGHIDGALSIHTQAKLFERYLSNKGPIVSATAVKPGFVLIFHCEYSSQRGPEMCRFLRDADRNVNMISYPAIYYPEMYILAGGYKQFYETHQQYCTPQKYVSMFDEEHAEEMKFYRSHSKSSLVKTKSTSKLPLLPELNRSKSTCFKKLELD